jgi:AcrR family transcriptional regulator
LTGRSINTGDEKGTIMEDRKSNDISQMRRSQLTKAAYKVVSRKGYYNFTIKDIAKESGLSSGLVHYYFKDKQDLLLNVLKEINLNIRSYLNKELVKLENPRDKLIAYIDQAFGLVDKEKEYFYVLIDFWTQVNHNPRMRQANSRLLQSYRDECAAILKEGISAGIFKEMDVAFTATAIVSIIQGAIIQYVLDNKAFDYNHYAGKIKDYIISIIMREKNS